MYASKRDQRVNILQQEVTDGGKREEQRHELSRKLAARLLQSAD